MADCKAPTPRKGSPPQSPPPPPPRPRGKRFAETHEFAELQQLVVENLAGAEKSLGLDPGELGFVFIVYDRADTQTAYFTPAKTPDEFVGVTRAVHDTARALDPTNYQAAERARDDARGIEQRRTFEGA